jgi:sensor domain CHASE-containing protein
VKIKTRSVAILLGTFIPLIAFVCLSVGLILLREHADLERRLVHRHTLRAVRAIQSELRALHTLNSDWAAWDDTCAFIVDRNMAYRQANLMDETFVSMQLSLLAFLDSEGKEVWLQMFDPIHQRTAATAPEVRAFLSQAGRRFV